MAADMTPFEAAPRHVEYECLRCHDMVASERMPDDRLCPSCRREVETAERYWDEDDRGLYDDREDA